MTPHKLRHTFASILPALGEEPDYVMDQLGHSNPTFTFRVYRHAMRRSEEEKARITALVAGSKVAPSGTRTAAAPAGANFR